METKRKYDPVKRKEYYERTKQLKGRNPSKAQDSFRAGERRMAKRQPSKKNPKEKAIKDAFERRDYWQKEIVRLRKAGKMNSPEMDLAIAAYFKASEDIVKASPNMSPG